MLEASAHLQPGVLRVLKMQPHHLDRWARVRLALMPPGLRLSDFRFLGMQPHYLHRSGKAKADARLSLQAAFHFCECSRCTFIDECIKGLGARVRPAFQRRSIFHNAAASLHSMSLGKPCASAKLSLRRFSISGKAAASPTSVGIGVGPRVFSGFRFLRMQPLYFHR